MWAMFCHLGGLGGYVFPFGGNVILPLVVWLVKKDQYPLVNDQGKESLNFQLSILLYSVVSLILVFSGVFAVVGIPLLLALAVFDIVMIVIASMKANEGVAYRYPLTIRFIS
jgi:uncharacterized Tic20 family protein